MTTEALSKEDCPAPLCVCGHERGLHHPEPGGLCIKDEWCQCPGYTPRADDERYGEILSREIRDWMTSEKGQKYSCVRGYGAKHDPDCEGCLLSTAHRLLSAEPHSPVETSGWRPIETAPTDGTEFVVFHKEAGVCACFRTGPTSAWYCMDGWNTYKNADGSERPGLTSFVSPPECWQPMPTPPSSVNGTS